jgi:hypothetical protein
MVMRDIIERQSERAENILREHRDELDTLASALLEYETLNAEEIKKVIKGEKLTNRVSVSQMKKQQEQQQAAEHKKSQSKEQDPHRNEKDPDSDEARSDSRQNTPRGGPQDATDTSSLPGDEGSPENETSPGTTDTDAQHDDTGTDGQNGRDRDAADSEDTKDA